MITGNNGILTRAKEAKEKSIVGMEKEQVQIAYLACKAKSIPIFGGKVTAQELEDELIKNNNDVYTDFEEDETEYIIYVTFNNSGNVYMVEEDGSITYIEDNKVDTSDIDSKLVLQNVSYADSTITLLNPDRGFYKRNIFTINGNAFVVQSGSLQQFCTQTKNGNRKLVQILIDLGQLSGNANASGEDKNLTNGQIQSLNALFETIRENNLTVIVRCVYSTDATIGKEPKSFNTVITHINQLSSIFYQNKDIISVIETGFLGPMRRNA